MSNDIVKLIVTDNGDESAGILPVSWTVETPFTNDSDNEDLEYFRNEIMKVYREFSDCKLIAVYDFEYEQAEPQDFNLNSIANIDNQ